jgi:hypothetical protein
MRLDFWRQKQRNSDLDDEVAHSLAAWVEEGIRSGSSARLTTWAAGAAETNRLQWKRLGVQLLQSNASE